MSTREATARLMAPPPRAVRLAVIALAVGIVAAVNFYLAARSIALTIGGASAVDWDQYVEAGRRVFADDLYAVSDTYAYHYSPLLAFVLGPLSVIGTVGWRLLHVAAALALPSWPMRVLALASWPLWYDVEAGNILTFAVLAAAWALQGSRVATAAYLILVVLVPRPLMLPVAIWLLWKRREWRWPFAIGFAVHAVAVVASGWGPDWVVAMLAAGGDAAIPSNVGPSRFIGAAAWLVVGIPISAFLLWKGRPGLASLGASPYWLPYYLLMPLADLALRPHSDVGTSEDSERMATGEASRKPDLRRGVPGGGPP